MSTNNDAPHFNVLNEHVRLGTAPCRLIIESEDINLPLNTFDDYVKAYAALGPLTSHGPWRVSVLINGKAHLSNWTFPHFCNTDRPQVALMCDPTPDRVSSAVRRRIVEFLGVWPKDKMIPNSDTIATITGASSAEVGWVMDDLAREGWRVEAPRPPARQLRTRTIDLFETNSGTLAIVCREDGKGWCGMERGQSFPELRSSLRGEVTFESDAAVFDRLGGSLYRKLDAEDVEAIYENTAPGNSRKVAEWDDNGLQYVVPVESMGLAARWYLCLH